MKSSRNTVYKALDSERDYQSNSASDVIAPAEALSIGDEILLIEEYLLKARSAWAGTNKDEIDALHIIRKIGAMCVRCMETHGAYFRE